MALRSVSAYSGRLFQERTSERMFQEAVIRRFRTTPEVMGRLWCSPTGHSLEHASEKLVRSMRQAQPGVPDIYLEAFASRKLHSVDAAEKMVQVGAGQIGRGLTGLLAAQAGYRVTFLDGYQPLIEQLRKAQQYRVMIGGNEVTVRDIHILNYNSEKDASVAEMVRCNLLFTAIGPDFSKVASDIARAVKIRMVLGINSPLNVVCLENLPVIVTPDFEVQDPLAGFKKAFFAGREADEAFRRFVEERIGFVMAIGNYPAGKINNDHMFLTVSGHDHIIPVDGKAMKNIIDIPEVKPYDDFAARQCMKLFAFNMSHTNVGVLGYHLAHTSSGKDIRTIPQAMAVESIKARFSAAFNAISRALQQQFRLSGEELEAYRDHTEGIFTEFPDEILRVIDGPFRKLGPCERLLGAIKLCMIHDVDPRPIVEAAAAAVWFAIRTNPSESKATDLQKTKKEFFPDNIDGEAARFDWVIENICRLGPKDKIAALIAEAYKSFRVLD